MNLLFPLLLLSLLSITIGDSLPTLMPKENEQIKYATHPGSKYKKKPPLENIL